MNGRCTADALDHADDICEFCGDEFCRSCLIQTRGGKGQQICRDCAIRNSGIKGTKSNKARPSKAQLQKAREALEEAKGTRRAKTFQFFDEEADYVAHEPEVDAALPIEQPPEESAERGGKRRFNLRRKDDDARSNDIASEPPAAADDLADLLPPPPAAVATGRSTPATALIESGALSSTPTSAPAPTEESVESEAATPPIEDPAESGFSSAAEHRETDREVLTQSAVESPTEPAVLNGDVSSGSLADRLRSRPPGEPKPASSFSPAPPAAEPALAPQPACADSPTDLRVEADPFAGSGFDSAPSAPAALDVSIPSAPVALDVSFPSAPNEEPFAAPAATFDWQSSPDPSADDLDADPFGGGDPFSPQQEVAQPLPDAPALATAPRTDTPPAVRVQPAAPAAFPQQATPVATQQMTPVTTQPQAASSADTDANGNWIPPLLRGMAPVAERRAAPLPKRRLSD